MGSAALTALHGSRCRFTALLLILSLILQEYRSFAVRLVPNGYCQQMNSEVAKKACTAFSEASTAEGRICKALEWRGTEQASYSCAGINDVCLAAESRLSSKRKSIIKVCTPLPEGTPCGSRLQSDAEPRCVRGVCVDKFGMPLLRPTLPINPIPSAARLAGLTDIRQIKLMAPAAPAGAKLTAALPKESITVAIDTVNLGVRIPHGFLGTSLEWQGIQYYGSNPKAWGKVLSILGPGVTIRIGGASQDRLTEVPEDASWQAMAALHREAGVKFILGLPLNHNNEDLIKSMITKARNYLPEEAILGFELGNEPSYWQCPGLGGWSEAGYFEPGWSPYADYFDRVARRISGCDGEDKGQKILIGPAWDNLNTFPMSRSDEVLRRSSCYLKDLSVHYYPYYSKSAFNHQSLLSEDLMREAARNATLHVKKAAAYDKAVRITEANSLSGSGEEGTSDAFAAALWTTDTAFEFAAAGIKSLSLHWGVGGLPDATVPGGGGVPVYAGIRTYHLEDGTSAPSPRAPWFGYLLFASAATPKAAAAANLGPSISDGRPGRLATVTSAVATPACSKGQIKVWPVVHGSVTPGRSELRVVVLNKSDRDECWVTLDINDAFGDALITWVMPHESTGPKRMTSKLIMFGGAMYTNLSGDITGTPRAELVAGRVIAAAAALGKLQRPGAKYTFRMPPATAAVVVAQGQA